MATDKKKKAAPKTADKPSPKKATAKKVKPAVKKATTRAPVTSNVNLTDAFVVMTTQPLSKEKGGDVTLRRDIGALQADGSRSFTSESNRDGGKPAWFTSVAKACSSPNGVDSVADGLREGENLYVQPIDLATGRPCMRKDAPDQPLLIRLGTITAIEQPGA